MYTININHSNRTYSYNLVLIDGGDCQTIAAFDAEHGDIYCHDIVMTNAMQKDHEHTDIVPQAGRFFGRDSRNGDSIAEDMLIMAGHMKVVGRVDTEYRTYAELRFDKEWLNSLPVIPLLDKYERNDIADNVVTVGYQYRFLKYAPIAMVKRGVWTWYIEKYGDYPDGWSISASNSSNFDKGFTTGSDHTLLEAWLEAVRLEKAMDEFVDMGNQIAEKYGVSFINNLIEHVAAGH